MRAEVEVETVLRALCDVGRPLMLNWMGLDSCIAACRVGKAVLRRMRIHSSPLAVKVAAFNAKGHEFMLDGHPEWVKEQRDGAYALGAGYGPGPRSDAWNGHLVLVVGSSHLLDLSGDQLSRPAHGISVGPFFAPLPTQGFAALSEFIVWRNPGGGAVVYEADPENDAWKLAPDWDLERWMPLVEEVHRAVVDALATGCVNGWTHCAEAMP